MKILIAGGSGFIGRYLQKRLQETGHSTRIVSRKHKHVGWQLGSLIDELAETDVLINLAGHTINCRFTAINKKKILESRILTTSLLNEAVAACKTPPRLWINASATGIYEHTAEEKVLDEYAPDFASDFLGEVVGAWETEFRSHAFPFVRKIALRTAMVLGKDGGAFPHLNLLAGLGLGGKQGSGLQMISWIHIEDYFRIILFLIEQQSIEGVVNAATPNPVTNAHLMRSLRQIKGVFFGMPAPAFIIKIASAFIGVDASLILDSVNVRSNVLKANGFEFKFPDIEHAINDLI